MRGPTIWLEFLYDALHSPFGIVVAVSDIVRARQALYRARADAKDPALDALKISTSPYEPSSELWIIKNGPPR